MEEEIIFVLNLELMRAGGEKKEVKRRTKIKRKEVIDGDHIAKSEC